MKRREFLKKTAVMSSTLYIPGLFNMAQSPSGEPVIKVEGESPYEMAKRAVKELGGMAKFISKQDIVMVKPNIGWNRTVEQAACTNPEVIRAVVEMAYNAGAKKVIVMDHTCHTPPEAVYRRSGITDAAKKAGAEIRYVDDNRLIAHNFEGQRVKKWLVYKDFLDVDKFINVPILKHHMSAGLTIGMKNLYGILGGNRGKLHRNIGQGIADLGHGFKTHLTIIDAYRVLLRNGPVGGRLSDVAMKKTLIASTNIMEADVVAVDVFGETPEKYDFIRAAFEHKMGQMDISKINLKSVKV
jgi:uncharacterized protein (DUF362 family)